MDINQHLVMGRLGRDPECRDLPSGGIVANFSVATNNSYPKRDGEGNVVIDPKTDKPVRIERTEWHRCVAWNSAGTTARDYLHKGDPVLIQGRAQTRSWEDDDKVKRFVTEIHVGVFGTRLDLIGRKANGDRVEDQPGFEKVPTGEDAPF